MNQTADDLELLRNDFVPEARDLLEAASEALLALEADPEDAEATNGLFRAVHTIKGTAGIFDLPSLVTLVHAAEDLLSAVREGRLAFSPEMTDQLLAGFDVLRRWLDELEQGRALPADSSETARKQAAAYRAWLGGEPSATAAASAGDEPAPEWYDAAVAEAAVAAAAPGARLALVTYAPAADSFFAGEDPAHLIRRLPGRVWFRAEAAEPWPEGDAFDPYACNLRFLAVSEAPRSEVEHLFRYVSRQVSIVNAPAGEVISFPGAGPDRSHAGLSERAQDVVAAQLRLFALASDGWRQRAPSLRATLANVLAASGAAYDAAAFEAALEESCETRRTEPLQRFFDALAGASGAAPAAVGGPEPDREVEAGGARDRTLKVDQRKIDEVMNLVGELIVAKNSLPFVAARAEDEFGCRPIAKEIKERYAVLDRIAQELQGAVMGVRMLPVAEMFRRFPRLVRDVSRKLGKTVELQFSGEKTEADKNIIEALADPLTHIIRNSLDHGLETPEERRAAGKPATGTIRLSAFQEGDRVVISVEDDGRGIDPEKVRAKAVQKGVISASDAEALSPSDAQQLIFAPGFSTAEVISDVSGRGVGMDVVRTTVEQLRGSLTLQSEAGRGTTISLSLPLSVALTQVMTVAVDGQLFGVPMDVVAETVRAPVDRIRRFKHAETFLLRDRVIPLVRLRKLLAMAEQPQGEEAILVVRLAGAPVGIVVDDFRTGMEVILKPLSGVLALTPGYAGTAVLGNGDVLLVLNLKELI